MSERIFPKCCPRCDRYTILQTTPIGNGQMQVICEECGNEGPACGSYFDRSPMEVAIDAWKAWNSQP